MISLCKYINLNILETEVGFLLCCLRKQENNDIPIESIADIDKISVDNTP